MTSVDTPTIPTNNNQLTNGAGYITGYTVTSGDVTAHQGSITITESQISDLGNYVVSGEVNPVLFSNQAAFPSASTYHGGIAHSHSDGAMYFAHGGSWNKLANDSDIPTNNNQLTNGAGYITGYTVTSGDVTAHQGDITITESQISDLGTYATTASLATVATSGSYNDLTNTPTIPTNNNQLTNGAGYITSYTVTEGDVTAHEGALTIGQSQVTNLTTDLAAKADLVGGVVPTSQIPSLAITEYLGSVANQTASGTDWSTW